MVGWLASSRTYYSPYSQSALLSSIGVSPHELHGIFISADRGGDTLERTLGIASDGGKGAASAELGGGRVRGVGAEQDCLVDLAHLVSLDFFDRPELYRYVAEDVVGDLTKLRVRYRCDENFLSREQRHEIFAGVFGEGEGAALMNAVGAVPPAGSFAGLMGGTAVVFKEPWQDKEQTRTPR